MTYLELKAIAERLGWSEREPYRFCKSTRRGRSEVGFHAAELDGGPEDVAERFGLRVLTANEAENRFILMG